MFTSCDHHAKLTLVGNMPHNDKWENFWIPNLLSSCDMLMKWCDYSELNHRRMSRNLWTVPAYSMMTWQSQAVAIWKCNARKGHS